MKKILIISNVPPLTTVGGGIRTIEIIELLRHNNFDLSIPFLKMLPMALRITK